ncbi:unnamed protein product [Meloidogyne enterolobii]|uniref:Uncharacterized protein n=1 Tax=Meloidogyne enterolobii TaxID=390850 RepID=A0ACB0ZVV5_MELEN
MLKENLNLLEDPRSLISLVQVGLENSDDSLKAQFYIYTLDNKGEKVFCSL